MNAPYPGVVVRQTLIDQLRARAKATAIEADQAWDAMKACNLSAADNQTLNDSYYLNLGRQQAFREISEWAARETSIAVVETGQEQYKNQIDGVGK